MASSGGVNTPLGPAGSGGLGPATLQIVATANNQNQPFFPVFTSLYSPLYQNAQTLAAAGDTVLTVPTGTSMFYIGLPAGNTFLVGIRTNTAGQATPGIPIHKLGFGCLSIDISVTTITIFNAGASTIVGCPVFFW